MIDWANLSTMSVLVVEDEPDNLEIIELALKFWGITVRTAANGVEGLKALDDFMPDLILLDLSMAKMDGWEMRARVRQDSRTRHIPIVALTAHAMSGDKERTLEVGFDGYLSKPISIPTFIQDLRAALEKPATASTVPPIPADSDHNSVQSSTESVELSKVVSSKET